jgi:glycosyltransferase involved in cell wall biosynthesis
MIRPRRVLITTDAVGGVWRYTIDLVHALDASGIACLVTGLGPEPDAVQRAECAWQHSDLIWTDHALDWTEADPAALARTSADLEHRARRWQADLIHLHLPSQAASINPDLPIVAVSHSCQPTWWQATRGDRLPAAWQPIVEQTRAGLARADRILAPTHAHADAIRRVYGKLDRLDVIPNAANAFTNIAEPKQPKILAAGRWWDAGKNAITLDRAARHVAWPIEMAGSLSGPDGSQVALDHATHIGEQSSAALRQCMSRATIFTSPSLYEPFGLAVLEAALHHCVLVLADIPTFRELWGGAAIFADPRDPAAFARALKEAIDNESRRSQLAQAAHDRAQLFTPDRQRHAILAAYEKSLPVAA